MLIILIAIVLLIVLVVAIVILNYRYTKASEALFAARQDVARYKARLGAASRAARDFEEQCSSLKHQLSTSLASTGQALNVARHIELIGQQMTQLLDLVAIPGGEHAAARDEYQLEPSMTPYGPRAIDMPAHLHADHTQPLPITHPGQRQRRTA
jgi:hypothetical protein